MSNKFPLAPEATHICVLYNPSNGRVVHTHRVLDFTGAKKTGKEHVEARCLTIAKKLGHATDKLKTLHVPHEKFKDTTPYKVDVKAGKLVEIPWPARKSKPAGKQK
jgi:hypothetical protein